MIKNNLSEYSINKFHEITSNLKQTNLSNDCKSLSKNTLQNNINNPFKLSITARNKTNHTNDSQYSQSLPQSYRQIHQSLPQIFKISEEVMEIYNEFEKNYNIVKQMTLSNLDIKQNNNQLLSQQLQTQYEDVEKFSRSQKMIDNLHHQELSYNMRINIYRFQFQYYRIKIKNQESPISIRFTNSDNIDIRSFYSTKIEFPNKFNCEQEINTKFIRILSKDNMKQFHETYLFMTLYSNSDIDSIIIVQFGTIKKKISKHSNNNDNQLKIEEENIQEFNLKTKKNQKSKQQEIKLQNILSFQPNLLDRQQKQIKYQQVQEIGKSLNQERILNKKSKLFVKEQMIHYRELIKSIQAKNQYKYNLQKIWIKSIYSTLFLDHLYFILECQRKQISIEARGKLLVWQLQIKSLISVKEFGVTPQERTLFKTKIQLLIHCQLNKKIIKHQAQKIITSFLKYIELKVCLINKHQRWINNIIKFQRNVKYMKIKKRTFKEELWSYIKKEFDDMIQFLIQLKGINHLYTFEEVKKVHLDTSIMLQLLDEFQEKRKKIWQKYIHDTYIINDKKNKLINLAINFKIPSLFEFPNELELIDIMEKYGQMKKIF